MRALRPGIILLLATTMVGCASDVEVAYPAPTGGDRSGEVLVLFSEPMASVSVLVDGFLVAEDRHTERVSVTGVPSGSREVRVLASERGRSEAVDRREMVTVDPRKPVVVTVPTPSHTLGYWIESAARVLASGLTVLWLER